MGTKGLRYATEERERLKRLRYETIKEKYDLETDEEVNALYAEWASKSRKNKGGKGGFANKALASSAGKKSKRTKKISDEDSN